MAVFCGDHRIDRAPWRHVRVQRKNRRLEHLGSVPTGAQPCDKSSTLQITDGSDLAASARIAATSWSTRGEVENRVKEAQLDLFGRRASCHNFQANQLRLLLAAFAYTLMLNLRKPHRLGRHRFAAGPCRIRRMDQAVLERQADHQRHISCCRDVSRLS
jgi:hypothetical protein